MQKSEMLVDLLLTIYQNRRKTHLTQWASLSFDGLTRQLSMVEIRHLQNAPIAEALIDFRVKNSNVRSLEKSLDTLKERIGVRYPRVQATRGFQAEVKFRSGGAAEHSTEDTGFQGYFFVSEDGLKIAQFRYNGFTFNRLKPYSSWEEILPEALDLWKLYIEVAKPEYIVRVSLRYINHIKLPLPIDDMSRYLTGLPDVPENTLYLLKSFLTRLLIIEPRLNLEAAVTQALEPDIESNSVVVILDIDTFKQKEFSPQDSEILTTLDALRKMKNIIFFGSITEETLRLFNGS
jgi:uncharacterized protein (TIGR04255 family)